MTTDADRDLGVAKKQIADAIKLLGAFTSGVTSGSDDYSVEYQRKIRAAFNLLLEIQDLIR